MVARRCVRCPHCLEVALGYISVAFFIGKQISICFRSRTEIAGVLAGFAAC